MGVLTSGYTEYETASHCCDALTERQKAKVSNADILAEYAQEYGEAPIKRETEYTKKRLVSQAVDSARSSLKGMLKNPSSCIENSVDAFTQDLEDETGCKINITIRCTANNSFGGAVDGKARIVGIGTLGGELISCVYNGFLSNV